MSGVPSSITSQLSADEVELLDELGGITDAVIDGPLPYDPKFRAEIDAQEKFPVFIPGEYAEFVQVNGLTFRINPEQVVMVPRTVKEILDNKRDQEREVRRLQARLKAEMSPSSLGAIRDYVR